MNTRRRTLAILCLMLLATAGTAAYATPPPAAPTPLVQGTRDQCHGRQPLVTPSGKVLCTHGNDPRQPAPTGGFAAMPPSSTPWPCYGTGADGPRVEALYVYPSSAPSQLSTLLPTLETLAHKIEGVFASSGNATGRPAYVRFVTTAPSECRLVVREVGVSAAAIGDFNAMINELYQQGFNRRDRVYQIWVDAQNSPYCGIGTVMTDDRPTQDNANNFGPSYARSDRGCWDYAEPHELGHTLGAVQPTAPHATNGWHCWDEYDYMCYNDGYVPNPPGTMQLRCADAAHDELLDCNHDDFFHTGSVPAGSYLSSHWNVANSQFLSVGDAPPPSSTTTTTAPPPTTTTTLPPPSRDATSTWLTSSRNPSSRNQGVTFTARVHCPSSPTGTVYFYVNGALRASASVDNPPPYGPVDAPATWTTSFRSKGTYTVTARYDGDDTCAPSSSNAVSQRVTR